MISTPPTGCCLRNRKSSKVSSSVRPTSSPRNSLHQARRRRDSTMHWAYQPSLALGGDLFQVSRWGTDTLGLYILDASGHGVAAALRAIALMSFLREDNLAKAVGSYDPGDIINEANRRFPLTQEGEYFTLWVGRLHLPSRTLTYAAAGTAAHSCTPSTGHPNGCPPPACLWDLMRRRHSKPAARSCGARPTLFVERRHLRGSVADRRTLGSDASPTDARGESPSRPRGMHRRNDDDSSTVAW